MTWHGRPARGDMGKMPMPRFKGGAVAEDVAQLADDLGGEPDAREVADAGEVGEHAGVAVVGFVGGLFHAVHAVG